MFISIQLVFCVLELARRGPVADLGVLGDVAPTLRNTEESIYSDIKYNKTYSRH